MTAVQRAKRNYYRRKKKRRRLQRRPRRILGRRRKPYARRRRVTTRKHVTRYARGYSRLRHLPTCRYYRKKKGENALSSQKARPTVRSARKKVYHRKPSRVGRPRKKKNYPRGRARILKRKIKATVGRKRAKGTQKTKKKPGRAADEMLFSLANSSTPPEDRQSKKHSGRFPSKDSESHSQEVVVSQDNQQNQQSLVSKKRGRVTTQQNP